MGPISRREKFIGLLSKIAEAEITIPHLHQRRSGQLLQSTLCLATEDFLRVQKELVSLLQNGNCTVLPAVGSITLFPHRSEFGLFTRVLHALAHDSIPLYGISTSVSALVIQTDYTLLEKGVQAILQVCELPENHTPLRPVVLLGDQAVETVAVYWEPRIRIYGMDIQHDLSHLALKCPVTAMSSERWQKIGINKEKFRLLLAQKDEQGNFCCDFLVDTCWRDSLSSELQDCIANEPSSHVVCNDNVIGIEDIKEEDCITIPLPSTSQTRSQRDWQTQLDDKDAGLPTDYLCVSLLLAYIAYKILYVWSYTCI